MPVIIRKKYKLDTRVKIGILTLLGCSVICLGIGIYREVSISRTKNVEQTVYEYSCQPKSEYYVHIRKNPVYEGTVQQENLNYSKKLLDYIEVKFGTEFRGAGKAETEFVYHITAQVQGYENMKGEAPVVDWSKDYELLGETKRSTSESSFLEERTVRFDLEDYEAFALKAREVTGMELSSQVVIRLEGNLNIRTGYGDLSTPVTASVTVPLQEEVFRISKEETAAISDNIINIAELVLPANRMLLLLFGLLIIACIAGILIVLLATESPNAYDLAVGKARKLLKLYGSRMIVIRSRTEKNYLQTYEVGSIDDLIKISDEIRKPIYYIKDDLDIIKDYTVRIADEDSLYVYRILD